MAYGTLHKGRTSSEAKRGSCTAGAACCLARSQAAPFPFVRLVWASGISVSAGGLPTRSSGRACRGLGAGHVEASAAHRGTAAEVCQKQRSDDGCDHDRRARSVPGNKEEAWLSRASKAACSKSTLTMSLIACLSPSSRRPTRFWCPLGNAPWGA